LRKILYLLSTLLFAGSFSSLSSVSASAFKDVENSYAKKEIEALVEAAIIDGYEDGTFRPKEKVTRAEFTKMLALALDLPANIEAADKFNDVPDWASPYIGALVEEGLIKGISSEKIGSDLLIERQDIMVMMMRVLGLVDYTTFLPLYPEFIDENDIAEYAFHKVAWAHYINLTEGYKGYFNPLQPAQRQDAARWIYELKFNKETYERNAMEIAIHRTFNPHAKQFNWIDHDTLEITFSTKEKKEYDVPSLMERVYNSLQYRYLSTLEGEEWITFTTQEKQQLIDDVINYWKLDYSYITLHGDDQELKNALPDIINDYYYEDEEYILYDEIVSIIVDYAVEHQYAEYKEAVDKFILP
jgi:hypothetical protein